MAIEDQSNQTQFNQKPTERGDAESLWDLAGLDAEVPESHSDKAQGSLINFLFDDWKTTALGRTRPSPETRAIYITFNDDPEKPGPTGQSALDEKGHGGEKNKASQPQRLEQLGVVPDFSIAREHFDQLNAEAEQALKHAGVERFSLVSTKNGGRAVLIELDRPRRLEIDAESGIKQLSFDKKTSFKISQDDKGNIEIGDVTGLKILLGGQPAIEATLQKLVMRQGQDGKPEIQLVSLVNGEPKVMVVKPDDRQVKAMNACTTALRQLLETSNTGLFSKIPENVGYDVPDADVKDPTNPFKLQKRREEEQNTLTEQVIDALVGVAVALAARKIGTLLFGRDTDAKENEQDTKAKDTAGDSDKNTDKNADNETKDKIAAAGPEPGKKIELGDRVKFRTEYNTVEEGKLIASLQSGRVAVHVQEQAENAIITLPVTRDQIKRYFDPIEVNLGNGPQTRYVPKLSAPLGLQGHLYEMAEDGGRLTCIRCPDLVIVSKQNIQSGTAPAEGEKVHVPAKGDRAQLLQTIGDPVLRDAAEEFNKLKWNNPKRSLEKAQAQYEDAIQREDAAFSRLWGSKYDYLKDLELHTDAYKRFQNTLNLMMNDFGNERAIEQALKDYPELLQSYRDVRLAQKHSSLFKDQADAAFEDRVQQATEYAAKTAGSANLPAPRIEIVESIDEHITSTHNGNKIFLTRSMFLGDQPSVQLAKAIGEGITRISQQSLVMRDIADKMEIGTKPTSQEIKRLGIKYAKACGMTEGATSREFVQGVLKLRDGKRLSVEQSEHAQELAKSISSACAYERMQPYFSLHDKWGISWLRQASNRPGDIVSNATEMLKVEVLPPQVEAALKDVRLARLTNDSQLKSIEARAEALLEESFRARMRELSGPHPHQIATASSVEKMTALLATRPPESEREAKLREGKPELESPTERAKANTFDAANQWIRQNLSSNQRLVRAFIEGTLKNGNLTEEQFKELDKRITELKTSSDSNDRKIGEVLAAKVHDLRGGNGENARKAAWAELSGELRNVHGQRAAFVKGVAAGSGAAIVVLYLAKKFFDGTNRAEEPKPQPKINHN